MTLSHSIFLFKTNHRHVTTLTTPNLSMQKWWELIVKLKITIRWCVHFQKWNLCWIIGFPLGCCDSNHVDIATLTLPNGKVDDMVKYMNLSKYIISTFEEFVKRYFFNMDEICPKYFFKFMFTYSCSQNNIHALIV